MSFSQSLCLIIFTCLATSNLRSTTISAGQTHSAFIDENGEAWTFGEGSFGKLGHGNTEHCYVPTKIANLDSLTAISAGKNHTVALNEHGQVWTFGGGTKGQLGHGDMLQQTLPKLVEPLSENTIVAISAGADHTAVLDVGGHVWTFGAGHKGQLGHGTRASQNQPMAIEMLKDVFIVALSAGDQSTTLLDSTGMVWRFGTGQASSGNGDQLQPKRIEGTARILAISSNAKHIGLLDERGAVWTIGSVNAFSRNFGTQPLFNPRLVAFRTPVIIESVAAGSNYSIALDKNGEVWTFGNGHLGQLGHNCKEFRAVSKKIINLEKIVAIDAGYTHSLALDSSGALWTFGTGTRGELGHGSKTLELLTPQRIKNLPTKIGLPKSRQYKTITSVTPEPEISQSDAKEPDQWRRP